MTRRPAAVALRAFCAEIAKYLPNGARWCILPIKSVFGRFGGVKGKSEVFFVKKKLPQNLLLVAFGVALYAALMNITDVVGFFRKVIDLVLPAVVALVLAFVLNVPMRGFEKLIRRITRKAKKPPKEKAVHAISLFLTLICIVAVLVFVFAMAIPELMESLESVYLLLQNRLPEIMGIINDYEFNGYTITDIFPNFGTGKLLTNVHDQIGDILNSVMGVAASTAGAVITFVFGVIMCIYLLLIKGPLSRQCKKLAYAYLQKKNADEFLRICVLVRDTFSNFLSGQCLEAVILGTLIFLVFTICGLPYAPLVGVLTGIFALIPYLGAYTSFAIAVLLTLLVRPDKVLVCIIAYLVTQFCETQFIYPHVVGGSVGLPPLWTLVAVILGGKLFGIMGIIFFIPLMSVVYSLLRDATNRRLAIKEAQYAAEAPAKTGPAETPEWDGE